MRGSAGLVEISPHLNIQMGKNKITLSRININGLLHSLYGWDYEELNYLVQDLSNYLNLPITKK